MQLQPLADRVIVVAVPEQEMTKSGIVLPSSNKEKPEQGEVIAVGPGKMMDNGQRSPVAVKVGDKVVFKKYGPDQVKIEDKEYLVLDESDILAIVA
jgi:chaperonin GroES